MLMAVPGETATTQSKPSVLHGIGRAVGGILFELPRTVLEATFAGPPIAGTAVGLLAGVARASQAIVGGVVEIAGAFDPWGTKRND